MPFFRISHYICSLRKAAQKKTSTTGRKPNELVDECNDEDDDDHGVTAFTATDVSGVGQDIDDQGVTATTAITADDIKGNGGYVHTSWTHTSQSQCYMARHTPHMFTKHTSSQCLLDTHGSVSRQGTHRRAGHGWGDHKPPVVLGHCGVEAVQGRC